MIDQINLPALVGAQLDQTLHTLRHQMGHEYAPKTQSLDWIDADDVRAA